MSMMRFWKVWITVCVVAYFVIPMVGVTKYRDDCQKGRDATETEIAELGKRLESAEADFELGPASNK
jgi:hypothetical protein